MNKKLKGLIVLAVMLIIIALGALFIGHAFAAPMAPIWPTGGEDGYIMVKSGDHQQENDFHMRWLNGTQKKCFITFDENGNTQFISLDAYSLSTHKHNMSELLGTDTFLYPHAALADNATHANEATHAVASDTAHIADNGMKGVVDGATPKEGEGYYYHENKWILGKTDMPVGGTKGQTIVKKTDADYDVEWVTAAVPPAPNTPNMVLYVNDKKQVVWMSANDLFFEPLKEAKNFYQALAFTSLGVEVVVVIILAILWFTRPKTN